MGIFTFFMVVPEIDASLIFGPITRFRQRAHAGSCVGNHAGRNTAQGAGHDNGPLAAAQVSRLPREQYLAGVDHHHGDVRFMT